MSNIQKHESSAAIAVVEEKTLISYLDTMGLAKNLTEQEKSQFIQIAKASNLNPFKREIYANKYGQGGELTIITGYEVYLKRAERTGMLNGWKVDISGSVSKGDLRAKITIYRKDQEIPFEWEVWYAEYVQLKKDGQPNRFWKEKPITMIKKVSMAQGFRLCFSDECGGMPYTAEEIGAETMDAHYQEVEEPKQKKQAAWVKKPEPQPAPQVVAEAEEEKPASVKQKTELLLLLNDKFISGDEKAKMLENINNLDAERIGKALAKVKATIELRKKIEAEQNQPASPADPMTKGQKDTLEQIISSVHLTKEEKDEYKAMMETMSKEDAEKTIKSLLKEIRERKERKEAA